MPTILGMVLIEEIIGPEVHFFSREYHGINSRRSPGGGQKVFFAAFR